MQHLEGSGTPVLYIVSTVLKDKDGECCMENMPVCKLNETDKTFL